MITSIFVRPEVLKNTAVCSVTPWIKWTGATFRKNVLRPSTGAYPEGGIVLSKRRYLSTKRHDVTNKNIMLNIFVSLFGKRNIAGRQHLTAISIGSGMGPCNSFGERWGFTADHDNNSLQQKQ